MLDKIFQYLKKPELYAERLCERGYLLTAIDFSKRSINYGKQKAKEKNRNIEYIYQNYLEMGYEDEFDLVTLIYCDFGWKIPIYV